MAIYHLSVKNISRSKGQSAISAAAYRSGTRLLNEEQNKWSDYTKKNGIEYSNIILPKYAPKEYQDRQKLWNAVQKIEKSKDARLCREFEVALPRELDRTEGRELVRKFAQSLADEGMCVDYSIHDKGDGNRHAHILCTTRAIDQNGEWLPKSKKIYRYDADGNKKIKKRGKDGRIQYDCYKQDTIDWNKTEKVEEWRKRWEKACNRYLNKENQIDRRSYSRQNKNIIPTIHEGYAAQQIKRKTGKSYKCDYNETVKIVNALRAEVNEQERIINTYDTKIELLTKKIDKLHQPSIIENIKLKATDIIAPIIKRYKQKDNQLHYDEQEHIAPTAEIQNESIIEQIKEPKIQSQKEISKQTPATEPKPKSKKRLDAVLTEAKIKADKHNATLPKHRNHQEHDRS